MAGDRVTFDIETSREGQPYAVSVRPVDRFQGTVSIVQQRGEAGIDSIDEDGQPFFVWANPRNTVPDIVGRTVWAVGDLAFFHLVEGPKEWNRVADDVRNENPSLALLDPTTYRESGCVSFYDGDRGHIKRETNGVVHPSRVNDTISFLRKNIICGFAYEVEVGSRLEFSVKCDRYLWGNDLDRGGSCLFWHRVHAYDLCTYPKDAAPPVEYDADSIEGQFASALELPLPEIQPPKAEPQAVERVYSESDRKKTLRQLIGKSI